MLLNVGCCVQLEKENNCGKWLGLVGTHKKIQSNALFPLLLPWWIQGASYAALWLYTALCSKSCAVFPRCPVLNRLCYFGWDVASFLFPLGYHYNLSLYFGPSASVHGISYLSWAHPEEAPLWTLPAVAEWWWHWGKFWRCRSCSLPVSALIWCGGNCHR